MNTGGVSIFKLILAVMNTGGVVSKLILALTAKMSLETPVFMTVKMSLEIRLLVVVLPRNSRNRRWPVGGAIRDPTKSLLHTLVAYVIPSCTRSICDLGLLNPATFDRYLDGVQTMESGL